MAVKNTTKAPIIGRKNDRNDSFLIEDEVFSDFPTNELEVSSCSELETPQGNVGDKEGNIVECELIVGFDVGDRNGVSVGFKLGSKDVIGDGIVVGENDGPKLGRTLGSELGIIVGSTEGFTVGY